MTDYRNMISCACAAHVLVCTMLSRVTGTYSKNGALYPVSKLDSIYISISIPSLWDQLQSEHVFLAQKATPLLMKCVDFILPHVTQSVDLVQVKPFQVFWDKVDSNSFKSTEWLNRFHAGESGVGASSI